MGRPRKIRPQEAEHRRPDLHLEFLKARPAMSRGGVTLKINENSTYISKMGADFLDLEETDKIVMAKDQNSGRTYIGKAPDKEIEDAVSVWLAKKGGGTIHTKRYEDLEPGKYYIEKHGIETKGTVLYPLTLIPEDEEQ